MRHPPNEFSVEGEEGLAISTSNGVVVLGTMANEVGALAQPGRKEERRK